MLSRRHCLGLAGLLPAGALAGSRTAFAQDAWPSRPVRIIVPSAAGGGADFTARLFGRFLERSGAVVVVDNRPGAGAVIGTDAAKSMPADGHNFVLATNSTHAANPYLFRRLPYDPIRDFDMVGLFGTYSSILVVAENSPYRSVADLLAAARAAREGIFFGYYSSSSRVPAELLRVATDTRMQGVSYRNITQILTDMPQGQLAFAFLDAVSATPALQPGSRLRPIAVSGTTRDARLPEVPTVAETIPGFAMEGWMGFAAPAGSPRPLLLRANAAIAEAVADPTTRERMAAQGLTPRSVSLEEAQAFLVADTARWAEWVRIAGIEPE